MLRARYLLLCFSAVAAVMACTQTEGPLLTPKIGTCGGVACAGCCDANGQCQAGTDPSACGANGAACAPCGAGMTCQAGSCAPSDAGTDAGADAGPLTCRPCLTDSNCTPGECVQYGLSDFCGATCSSEFDCPAGEKCIPAITFNGDAVQVCAPANGSCGGGSGCPSCPAGTACDPATVTCVPLTDGGSADAGSCGSLVPPSTSSCCHSCTPGTGDCQTNGCYGGWWCDTAGTSCRCMAPPTSCGPSDAGVDGGVFDGGPPVGTVGADGGTVSRLFFAVVGDTRPANLDDTANYPTAVISKIYADLQAMNPPPQFVVSTGDYMFATPTGSQGPAQMQLYSSAAAQFTHGPVFGVLGNHECQGYTDSNCASGTAGNNNYAAYLAALVTPLGKAQPYYALRFAANDGSWTAKMIVIACNAWDANQLAWLQSAVAQPTTYTMFVRHEPLGTFGAPCVTDSDPVIQAASYDQFIVGHTHTYSHSAKTLIVGNGGAPSSVTLGYVTIEQQPGIGFKVTEYDYATAQPIDTWYFQ